MYKFFDIELKLLSSLFLCKGIIINFKYKVKYFFKKNKKIFKFLINDLFYW